VPHQKKESSRLFIAVKLPDFIKEKLIAVQKTLQRNKIEAKYTYPGNMHLTLKFLGNVDHVFIPEIKSTILNAVRNRSSMELAVKGIGAFPSFRFPKVVWAGINGDGQKLESLHAGLEQKLADLGISREKRKYRGHVTILRLKPNKSNAKKLEKSVKKIGEFESDHFIADKIILFQSTLRPEHPIYKELSSWKLS